MRKSPKKYLKFTIFNKIIFRIGGQLEQAKEHGKQSHWGEDEKEGTCRRFRQS